MEVELTDHEVPDADDAPESPKSDPVPDSASENPEAETAAGTEPQ